MKFRLVENMTPDQQEFFKDSKLKRIYYHASNTEFDEFDKAKIGSGSGGLFGNGFYFAYHEDTARTYGKYVRAFYLNAINPYEFYSFDNLMTLINKLRSKGIKIDEEELESKINEDGFDMEFDPMDTLDEIVLDNNWHSYNGSFSELVRECGFDAINSGEEVVCFEPNQAKLVTNEHPTSRNKIGEELNSEVQ